MSRKVAIAGLIALAVLGGSLAITLTGGSVPSEDPAPDASERQVASGNFDPRRMIDLLPPDSIPAIDDPRFVSIEDADFLSPNEPVVSLELNEEARAYPLQILTWHEIVNDVVAGQPVAVTYCPLCNSAVVFERVHKSTVLDFGTSGKLYDSALVMYDRQTDSLWLHFEGRAVQGELAGARLAVVPAQILSFEQFRQDHTDGLVLSKDTGFSKPYGTNPYDFYDTNESPFLFRGNIDDRLNPIERVVGIEQSKQVVAFPYSILSDGFRAEAGVVQDRVGGREVAVFWRAGVASALDSPEIALGRDVGSSGVFVPEANGRRLNFRVRDGEIVDRETSSVWSLGGLAVSGPLEGEQLEPVAHINAFWFAWQAYHPDTHISRADPAR
ncbi:MAG: DUF3179 domain-containing protein [Actinomycetota bacterium]